ncbi:hypothetical protein [Thermophilibacter provencensis]|uniref:hypothetical protein n=1 Tax=Thermophilibacter provencensis TaxID=1852386 RepID=UPI003AA9B8A3
MPQVGVGVSVITLTNNGPSGKKGSMPVQKVAPEFGDERASKTANVDPSRSHLNTYEFPEGCGTSGEALADWFVQKFEDYSLEQQRAGKRKPSSLTAVGVGCVIAPDEEAVAQWDAALREKFVRDSREVYGMWFGASLDAWATHVDEGAMEERGLTRDDELGDEGLHLHGAGRMPDKLPDDDLLVEGFGEAGAAAFKKRYRGKDDGCLYRTGSILNGGRIKLLHNIFPIEMAKRGWREPVDENDLEATGWTVKPHLSYGEKKQIEEETGKVFKPAGQSANKYARTQRWQREQEEKASKNAADEKRNAADAERNADMRRVISENAAWNEEEARALDRRADELEREARDARVEISHEHRRLAAREDEADRMRARAEVALHGYTPPAGVTLVPPLAMPPELRALWRLTDGDEGDDAIGDIPGDLLGEDGEPDLDAANERVDDLADEFARERGYAQAYVDGDGAWLVTPPLEFMRQQDGYEGLASTDELTNDDMLYWSEKWWDEASLRIADAQLLGLDPTVPHPGIDEREAAVEAARADVERRDRVVGEREAAFERLTEKRRSVVDALDAEIEAKRAEAARLDAKTDETVRWLEGAVEHVKEADAYVEQAREDAEATRRAAEADAERTRERARVEAREGVSSAVGDAGAKVSRLVAEFTSTVVGNVCQLAFATLKAMRDNMALGDEFDRAATTCMATLHQVVEQDRDGSIARAIEGRARDVMNAAFNKRARREVVDPVFAEDWEPRPSGRSRDDGPGF